MNAPSDIAGTAPAARQGPTSFTPRREPRRDFGIGYGSSSGYIRRPGYTRSSMSPRFRMM